MGEVIDKVRAVLDESPSYGLARLVLISLAERSNRHPELGFPDDAVVWAGALDMAFRANAANIRNRANDQQTDDGRRNRANAVRSVRRAVNELLARGEIEVVGAHSSGVPIYRVNADVMSESQDVMSGQSDDRSASVERREPGAGRHVTRTYEPEGGSRKEVDGPTSSFDKEEFFAKKNADTLRELEEQAAAGSIWHQQILESERRRLRVAA